MVVVVVVIVVAASSLNAKMGRPGNSLIIVRDLFRYIRLPLAKGTVSPFHIPIVISMESKGHLEIKFVKVAMYDVHARRPRS